MLVKKRSYNNKKSNVKNCVDILFDIFFNIKSEIYQISFNADPTNGIWIRNHEHIFFMRKYNPINRRNRR